jgi:RND family efflux transporter MFP subunit
MRFFIIFSFLLFFSAGAFAQSGGILVSTVKVQSDNISQTRTYIGNIKYATSSRIASEQAGLINSLPFEEGDRVKKGATLFSIDTEILLQNINAAKAKVEQQKISLEKARRDFERVKLLFEGSAATKQRLQDAETDYKIAQNALTSAIADLNILEEQFRRSSAKAPYDAVIVKKNVNVGEWVSVGAAVYEISEQRLEVVFNVPQMVVGEIAVGGKAEVVLGEKKFVGVIRTIVPQADTVSRTFPVKIDLPYSTGLMGGMDCSVRLGIGKTESVQLVPIDAVVKRDNMDAVFTINDNKAQIIPVTVIGYKDSLVGFQAAEKIPFVITRGNESLADGQPVRTVVQ